MRRDKVFRFVIVTFAIGAFVGLIGGLAFGGGSGKGTPRLAAVTSDDTQTGATDSSADTSTVVEPMTAGRAEAIGANEMGQFLVLMYHHFGPDEAEWTRTPANFRNDLALLKAEGFYPVNVRDLITGNIDIPAGKTPVVITFDDSSSGQYRILDDGTIDPDCAVAMMQEAVDDGDWASRASFFCLIEVDSKDREIFGQEEVRKEKLTNLIDWGYEVGSHTVTHLDLGKASEAEAVKQLAQSQSILEGLIGDGYEVTSISIPFGSYPESDSILTGGQYEDITYAYTAALSLGAVPCPSPFSTEFRPLHIPRIRGSAKYITDAIKALKKNSGLRYISDGDPITISAPENLTAGLGELPDDLGRKIIRY
ncbi:MAG: polysaccharide deacetylase family protein [Thermoleophilia bacterium]|nr:polysaccharide deacetylase family protein [Thermoleophilia bacterium]